jgi:hypothetical protein
MQTSDSTGTQVIFVKSSSSDLDAVPVGIDAVLYHNTFVINF